MKDLEDKIAELELKLWQAKGALGYAVPGHIPEGTEFKCGLCEAKVKRIRELEKTERELLKSHH